MMSGPCSAHERGEKNERAYKILVGKREGKNQLVDPYVDGKIILKWMFEKQGVRVWTGFT
jgi:hypothetical protein